MAKRLFVINEWLLSDLGGENGSDAQEESVEFLLALRKKCDRIAVLRGSPWMRKADALMKSTDVTTRRVSKMLHLSILRDSNKCNMFDEQECAAVPESLKGRIHEKDEYLFRLFYASNADSLVTADARLQEQVAQIEWDKPPVFLRDEFLRQYRSEARGNMER